MAAGANRRWGFHQLADPWPSRLVDHAQVRPGNLVLDIGAGTGAITAPLVAAGARVVAIELHPARLDALRRRFDVDSTPSGTGQVTGQVRVVRADATDLRLPRRAFRVVANPPWAATTAILRRLLSPGSRLVRADLVVPLHVAARWAGGRGPAAPRWMRTFDAAVSMEVPPSAFRPRGPRRAAVLTLQRRRE